MKARIGGHEHQGTAEEILAALKSKNFDPGVQRLNTEDYINYLRHSIWRLFGKSVNVEGDTTEERARAALKSIEEINLVLILEE